jgi:hypothetical protein
MGGMPRRGLPLPELIGMEGALELCLEGMVPSPPSSSPPTPSSMVSLPRYVREIYSQGELSRRRKLLYWALRRA